jgi:hypothetical protein
MTTPLGKTLKRELRIREPTYILAISCSPARTRTPILSTWIAAVDRPATGGGVSAGLRVISAVAPAVTPAMSGGRCSAQGRFTHVPLPVHHSCTNTLLMLQNSYIPNSESSRP